MKLSSLPRLVLFGCVLGVASVTAASAQETTTDTSTAPAPGHHGGFHHHGPSVLTPAEWAELKKDRDQVLAANPYLKQQGDDLHAQGKSLKGASAADKQAFFSKFQTYRQQVDQDIVQLDPNAGPIIDKLKAAHQHHHFHGGANAPSGSNTSTSNS